MLAIITASLSEGGSCTAPLILSSTWHCRQETWKHKSSVRPIWWMFGHPSMRHRPSRAWDGA